VTTTNAEDERLSRETTMSKWIGLTVLVAALAMMALGCAQP
jgi:hypothetical protein